MKKTVAQMAMTAARELEEIPDLIADAHVAVARLLGMLHWKEIGPFERELMSEQLGALALAIAGIESATKGARQDLPDPKRGPSPADLEMARRGLEAAS